ncbi:glycoside hydrolase family 43 protein [Paenibacillus sp. N4]|uniref:glycoside hydrolase family 43 protein n=1 Tax=Paenibacillus vietnamensis TaxID=2590547 RepID=UPI001CD143C3|nr:glycoside hydrolase family 43 protein [Paenibacillus vietnamensis]MCA0755805.1 glycoside hydrolase family 43 protein [Paenibacillus vietnamensis]
MARRAEWYRGLRAGIGAALAASLLLTGCSDAGSGGAGNEEEVTPVFGEASVHDPSVIRAEDGTYYVFGSHLAAAKSKDLLSWELVASGAADGNPLIPNVTEELRETFEWAQTDTLWAADVIRLPDGKYYMYYNACRGDSPLSAMGIAVADDIEGPYKDLGIILKSGMWGEPSEDGEVYDAAIHPNVVDPHVFFDKDGKLWMVYGSYSGGIFILEMDENTGKPLPDQGYGKKLLGGNHSRIEGPYMLYSPDTDYYYLFLSFGGLDAAGGYNIRVARSKNPDGPFVDAEENDMLEAKADPALPLFDDRSIEPFGTKLMGGHLWNDPAEAGREAGYVSPGHNSAYYDEANGNYYLFFHSRFPNSGEKHEIRVHQFFLNEEGWPVVAPFRYAGETLRKAEKDAVAGDYELVNHGKDISAELKESAAIRLEPDGTVTGAASGEWALTGEAGLRLTVDGDTYDGYWLRSWDYAAGAWTVTFTVLSKKGVSLWGARRPDPEQVSSASANTTAEAGGAA